jgi:CRP/FNR family transcriptional regulator, cyclic AMP receptor protein
MEKYDTLVCSHPFWLKLDPRHLGVLKECVTMVRFGLGQPIFQSGSNAEQFYLIHTGRVGLEMFVRGEGIVTIQTVDASEAFGWSWLFPPYRWCFDASAYQVTDALVFPSQTLRSYAEKDHDFGYELIIRLVRVMLQRLQATRLKLADFYGAIKDSDSSSVF